MKAAQGIALGVALALATALAGYWLGTQRGTASAGGAAPAAAAGAASPKAPKLLYYRNPMGLPDTSPSPKKDPMGMDYVPVYEGAEPAQAASANQLSISTEKVQKLGVRSEAAQLRSLERTVRAAARIEPDERRLFAIAPKFEGYVERLHVNVTGQPVVKGQPLFEVYSPELVSAQREYAIATQGVASLKGASEQAQLGMQQLAESSLQRLKNWDISEQQIQALAKSGEAKRSVSYLSPVSGIVTEKKAVQGIRFMPGEVLYQVADLSSVWVLADVFEQDIGLVKLGAKATVHVAAYPGKVFGGTVTYVYPTLKAETRTVAVRIELANPGLLLKPAMFAQVELAASNQAKVVTVPLSAVIDSGTRQVLLIQQEAGRFEPREVKLGARSDTHVEVLQGVLAGEQVVVSANFLIDAESNLKAAVGGFAQPRPQSAGHQAQGTVDSVDAQAGTVTLNHGPVASLKWPAMTMEFKAANPALLKSLQAGAKLDFEFVERQPGEWVITSVKPAAVAASAAAGPHSGH